MVNATKIPYDLTNVTSTGNILEFIQEVNKLSGEWFMSGMLFAGFVIMFVSMRYAGNKEALPTSSFIIAIMAIFFRALEFISTAKLVMVIIVFVVIFTVSTQIKT